MSKKLYCAYAQYLNGSTGELVDVYINCSHDRKTAVALCEEYAKEQKGVIRTWVK